MIAIIVDGNLCNLEESTYSPSYLSMLYNLIAISQNVNLTVLCFLSNFFEWFVISEATLADHYRSLVLGTRDENGWR